MASASVEAPKSGTWGDAEEGMNWDASFARRDFADDMIRCGGNRSYSTVKARLGEKVPW